MVDKVKGSSQVSPRTRWENRKGAEVTARALEEYHRGISPRGYTDSASCGCSSDWEIAPCGGSGWEIRYGIKKD